MLAAVHPDLVREQRYVPARGIIEDVEYFDHEFFGFNPRDAQLTDPQHRIFLECCWQALADAGYVPGHIDFPVSVFAGTGANGYREIIRAARPETGRVFGSAEREIGNEKDFLPTMVWSRLRLTGPSVDVQTACVDLAASPFIWRAVVSWPPIVAWPSLEVSR